MIIKAFAAVAGFGLIAAGPCLAQAIYEKPEAPYAPVKPKADTPSAEATVDAKAYVEPVVTGKPAIVDGQLRIPVSTDVAAKVGIPIEVVASAPVPDTAANRAKYGGPDSNGGARTAAAGN